MCTWKNKTNHVQGVEMGKQEEDAAVCPTQSESMLKINENRTKIYYHSLKPYAKLATKEGMHDAYQVSLVRNWFIFHNCFLCHYC